MLATEAGFRTVKTYAYGLKCTILHYINLVDISLIVVSRVIQHKALKTYFPLVTS